LDEPYGKGVQIGKFVDMLFVWFREPGSNEHMSDYFRKACWGKEAL